MAATVLSRSAVEQLAARSAPIALKRFPSSASVEDLARLSVAVALQESSWRPGVAGGGGSVGLMQVRPATQSDIEGWLGLGHHSGYDAQWSMTLGATYLAYQWKRYNSREKAIYAYNAGSYPGKSGGAAWAREYTRQVEAKYASLWGGGAKADQETLRSVSWGAMGVLVGAVLLAWYVGKS